MPRQRSSRPRPNVWANEHCRTYDPQVEGYGSPEQWQAAFKYRMGLDAAREAVGNDSPWGILGVALKATWDEIKTAWRKLVRKFHPDNQETGNEEMFKKVQGAYEVLEDKHSKGQL